MSAEIFLKVKSYLKRAYRLNELIYSNEQELDELRELSRSISGIDTSKDKVQTSLQGDASYTKIIEKIDELERVIKNDIENLLKLKLEIRNTINSVPDNEERLLLQHRYLNFMTWESICDLMSMSTRTVHRIHIKALKSVSELIES